MNSVNIAGRIARELTIHQSGGKITGVSGTLAFNPNKNDVDFFSFRLKGKYAPMLAKMGKKGDKLILSGRLRQDSAQFEDKTRKYDFIEVETFYVVPKRSENNGNIEGRAEGTTESNRHEEIGAGLESPDPS